LIFLAAQAAQHDRWGKLAGFICLVLVFLSIPAGGMKWFRNVLRGQKPPEPPASWAGASSTTYQKGDEIDLGERHHNKANPSSYLGRQWPVEPWPSFFPLIP
jgi:hypothetical protein